jgi:hypothetical protein
MNPEGKEESGPHIFYIVSAPPFLPPGKVFEESFVRGCKLHLNTARERDEKRFHRDEYLLRRVSIEIDEK